MSTTEQVPAREPLTVLFSARTDTGLVRTTNEDNFLVDRRLRLYIVCDGLGGHQGGEIASAAAVNAVREGLLRRREVIDRFDREHGPETDLLEALAAVAQEVNLQIYERGRENPSQRGMGTTLSLLLLAGDRGFVVHVGDTRIYRLRAGALAQVTEDHSLVTEMRRNLQMTKEQVDALDGRLKNQITRAVGVHDTVEVDVFSINVLPGDRYLLCSDGLHGLVPDAQLKDLVAHPDLVEAASHLVDRANAAGGKDNITAIVVQLESPHEPDAPRQIWHMFEVVRGTTLFHGLGDLELTSVIDGMRQVELKPNEALVRDFSGLPGLFVVLDGELQVVRQAELVTFLKRGDFFGEDALLIERRSGASIIDSGNGSKVALMERRQFEELQRTLPSVALKLAIVIGRLLARKIDASARDTGSVRFLYKDPGALSRPMPRPQVGARVLADTEPEPFPRTPAPADVKPFPPTVLRRPRGGERRSHSAVTQPAIPVLRGPQTSEAPTSRSAPDDPKNESS